MYNNTTIIVSHADCTEFGYKETRIPILITLISTCFWLFSNTIAVQVVLILLLCFLTLKDPSNSICFLLSNDFMLGSSTPIIAGVSVFQILGFVCIVSCLAMKKNIFKKITHPISILTFIVSLYFSISYYSYFNSIDLTILNNPLFMLICLWSVNFNSLLCFRKLAITIVMTSFVLIFSSLVALILKGSIESFTIFGNIRQIGFYGILVIPYIFILSKQLQAKSWLFKFIKLYFFLIIIFNFATIGRLNIFIIFIILCMMAVHSFGEKLIPRKYATIFIICSIFIIPTKDFVSDYIIRGSVSNINELNSLNGEKFASFSSGRSVLYKAGLKMFMNYPLFGGGYKRWGHISNKNNPFIAADKKDRLSMHSTLLQYLAETGIVGLSLYCGLLLVIGIKGYRAISNKKIIFLAYDYGMVAYIISIVMALGGTLDNHNFAYRQLFFAIAVCVAVDNIQKQMTVKPRLSHL